MNQSGNAIVTIEEAQAKLDEATKEVFADKQYLARIMKRFVSEYSDCSLEDIQNKYIEEGSIHVSKVGVAKNLTNIEGNSNDDTSINEGNVRYDILFHAIYPGDESLEEKRFIGLYINIELQNKYYPGYPLEMRGIYYSARRLSSQLIAINENTNYGCLEKVYSIWICMGNVPDKDAGIVSRYYIEKDDIILSLTAERHKKSLQTLIHKGCSDFYLLPEI